MCRWRMSLRRIISPTILVTIILCLLSTAAFADFRYEVKSSGGYTDNLFSDSTRQKDSYAQSGAVISYYPFSNFKLELNGDYTYYNEINGLSNFGSGFDITWLPLEESSPLSLYINYNLSILRYRDVFEYHNNDNYNFSISLSNRNGNIFRLRAGFQYRRSDYINEPEDPPDTGFVIFETFDTPRDNENLEFFIGTNFSLPGKNVIDLEIGYAAMNITYAPRPTDSTIDFSDPMSGNRIRRDYLSPVRDTLQDDKLWSLYFSPRFSRPIGSKTGINITYIYRQFLNPDQYVIPGMPDSSISGISSTGFLSPWISVYEGHSISTTFKTYIIPGFILTGGAGYWKKNFLLTEEERGLEMAPPNIIKDRIDEQNRFYINIQKPFTFRNGLFLEPAILIDYSDNNSSNDFYDYTGLTFSAGITFRM